MDWIGIGLGVIGVLALVLSAGVCAYRAGLADGRALQAVEDRRRREVRR